MITAVLGNYIQWSPCCENRSTYSSHFCALNWFLIICQYFLKSGYLFRNRNVSLIFKNYNTIEKHSDFCALSWLDFTTSIPNQKKILYWKIYTIWNNIHHSLHMLSICTTENKNLTTGNYTHIAFYFHHSRERDFYTVVKNTVSYKNELENLSDQTKNVWASTFPVHVNCTCTVRLNVKKSFQLRSQSQIILKRWKKVKLYYL